MHLRTTTSLSITALLAAAVVLAGCSTPSGSDAPTGDTQVADLAAATAYLEPYTKAPAGLLIDEPITTPPAAGSKVAFLDGGTPIQAIFWDNLQAPAEVLGIEMVRVQTGSDAQGINTALNSVVESSPAAVINVGIDPQLFSAQLDQLRDADIPVVSASIVNGDEFDLTVMNGRDQLTSTGKALVSAAIVRTEGKASKFVFYTVPELAFSGVMLEGAQEQIAALCPECELRVVEVPISTLGSTASDLVVSDLEAHPDTEYFIASLDEIQIGLSSKLDLAGLDVRGIGSSSAPANFEAIGADQQDAALALDLGLFVWTLMDQTVRELAGQPVEFPSGETVAYTLQHLITKDGLEPDQIFYTAIPDYREQFTKLWTGE